ncbi:MAG: alkaline phosphatase [Muribaculaceae bacterium]|nr:alkaline phosphatase [Muribaculaceae bacterium]
MKYRLSLLTALSFAALSLGAAPRYVFYFIGDGMGMGHVTTAQTYFRDVLKTDKPPLMMSFPVAGIATTYSASSPVTDSAAAGTALSTGHKTKNGMIGMTPDTTAVYSITRDLLREGYGLGIVTNVAPDDATPAAFYANVESRKMFYEIDCQAAEYPIDFLAGASLRGAKDKGGKPTDVIDRFKKNHVTVTRDLNAARDCKGRVVLLGNDDINLNNNDLGFAIDSIAGNPTLPQITEACLDKLARDHDKFFMMVEGGNIDHAAHANDGAAVIMGIIEFNQAIEVAYKFYLAHPDETLIVITADHDTGGMALSGGYSADNNDLSKINCQRISKDRFTDEMKAKIKDPNYAFPSWKDYRKNLERDFGLDRAFILTPEQEADLQKSYEQVAGRNDVGEKGLYNTFDTFTRELYRLFDLSCGIKWISGSHSGNPVPVYAVGVGAEQFSSLNNNTDIPRKILKAGAGN